MERLIPESMQKTYDKAMTGKSRGAAIKAFCCECCGYERQEVSLCKDSACPLHPYRPFRSSVAIRKAREQAEAQKKAAADQDGPKLRSKP